RGAGPGGGAGNGRNGHLGRRPGDRRRDGGAGPRRRALVGADRRGDHRRAGEAPSRAQARQGRERGGGGERDRPQRGVPAVPRRGARGGPGEDPADPGGDCMKRSALVGALLLVGCGPKKSVSASPTATATPTSAPTPSPEHLPTEAVIWSAEKSEIDPKKV